MSSGFFRTIARFQKKFYLEILILAIIVTVFLAFHSLEVQFESDISKEMPDEGQVFTDTLYYKENFEGSNVILITYEVDDNINDNPVDKITEAEVIESLYRLDGYVRELNKVQDTQSLGSIFKKAKVYPASQQIVDMVLSKAGEHKSRFLSDDRKASLFIVYVDNLETKAEIDSLVNVMKDKIDRSNPPYGVETTVSGNPVLKANLHRHLENDYFFTIGVAVLLISAFVYSVMRKIKSTLLILAPIVVGLVWYGGFIHLLGLKLSVSTVATGAMVVGLGVEYSIFIYNKLEKSYADKNGSVDERLEIAVEEAVGFTGKAIFGSALTTSAAFLSLTLSVIPMLSHLGLISAIGILSILFHSVFVNPCLFMAIEKLKGDINV